MRSPLSGLANSSHCKAFNSSSGRSSAACRVKNEVSLKSKRIVIISDTSPLTALLLVGVVAAAWYPVGAF